MPRKFCPVCDNDGVIPPPDPEKPIEEIQESPKNMKKNSGSRKPPPKPVCAERCDTCKKEAEEQNAEVVPVPCPPPPPPPQICESCKKAKEAGSKTGSSAEVLSASVLSPEELSRFSIFRGCTSGPELVPAQMNWMYIAMGMAVIGGLGGFGVYKLL